MQSPRKDKYDEISTGILLSCDEMVDRVGVLIADRYTENYDFNADLAKFDNHDLTAYAISKSGNLSYMAISPQTANQSIEIGYKVLEGNQFTFRFDDSRYKAQSIDKLYLIDKELNVTTDLLQTDYSFYSNAGTYEPPPAGTRPLPFPALRKRWRYPSPPMMPRSLPVSPPSMPRTEI